MGRLANFVEGIAGAVRNFVLFICSTAPGLPAKLCRKLPFLTDMFKSVIFDNVSFLFTIFLLVCALWGGSDTAALFFTFLFGIVLVWNHYPRPDVSTENEVVAPGQALIIGSRGAGQLAPENTLASINKAHTVGAKGVMVDLAFTQDDKAVLMKEDDVSWTTNGRGLLSTMPLEVVRDLDAGANFPTSEYKGEKVPTLEEAIFECMRDDTKLFICVKELRHAERAAMVLKRVFKKYQLYRSAAVCSYFPNVLYKIREVDSRIVCCSMYHPRVVSQLADGSQRHQQLWKQWLSPILDYLVEWLYYSVFWYLIGISIAIIHKSEASKTMIEFWENKGIRVIVQGIDNENEVKYFRDCIKVSYVSDYFEPQ